MDGLDIFDYIYIHMLLPQICRMKLYVAQKCVEAVRTCMLFWVLFSILGTATIRNVPVGGQENLALRT